MSKLAEGRAEPMAGGHLLLPKPFLSAREVFLSLFAKTLALTPVL